MTSLQGPPGSSEAPTSWQINSTVHLYLPLVAGCDDFFLEWSRIWLDMGGQKR